MAEEDLLGPEDERAVERLQHTYCAAVDAADVDAIVEVFTVDAVIDYGLGRLFEGVAAIRGMYVDVLARYAATSHHQTGILVTADGASAAVVTSAIYAFHRRADDGARVEIWGRYLDRVVRTAEGWRISRRAIRVAGSDGFGQDAGRFEMIERRT